MLNKTIILWKGNDMQALNICEIVDKLIGDFSAHGESNHDTKSLKILEDEVKDLLFHLIDQLVNNAKLKDDHRGSMRDIGLQSNDILFSYYIWLKGLFT
jgi:hypothetical protein